MLPTQNEAFSLWERVLEVLPYTMDKSTHTSLFLSKSYGVKLESTELTVCVKDELIKQRMEGPLKGNIESLVKTIASSPISLKFITEADYQEPFKPVAPPAEPSADDWSVTNLLNIVHSQKLAGQPTPPEKPNQEPEPTPEEDKPSQPQFDGFTGLESNFTLTPDVFFEKVLKLAAGSVVKLVGATIHQTIGQFEDKRGNRRREEWAVNDSHAMEVAGIGSRPTYRLALWDALDGGYLIQRFLEDGGQEQIVLSKKFGYTVRYTLRVRYKGEPICYPLWPRPEYDKRVKGGG